MSCWAVIPIKAPPDRKTRLAGALDETARDSLVQRMAAHVAAAAAAATGINRVTYLTANPIGLLGDVPVLADSGGGLNGAVAGALAQIAEAGGTRVVIVAGDLPLVTATEIALLAAVADDAAAIAPDRHGFGTNALSLPLPRAAGFRFAFGADSLARHRAEAVRLALDLVEVRSEGLARDIDLPDDLADAAPLMHDKPSSERT